MAIRLARSLLVLVVLTPLVTATSRAATIDPAAMAYRLPATIEWRDNPNNPGVKSAVLYGDPTKPGPYVVRVKWLPGHVVGGHRREVRSGEHDPDASRQLRHPLRREDSLRRRQGRRGRAPDPRDGAGDDDVRPRRALSTRDQTWPSHDGSAFSRHRARIASSSRRGSAPAASSAAFSCHRPCFAVPTMAV